MAFWIVISKEFVLLLHLSACSGLNFALDIFTAIKHFDPLSWIVDPNSCLQDNANLIHFQKVTRITLIQFRWLLKILLLYQKEQRMDQSHLVRESGSNSKDSESKISRKWLNSEPNDCRKDASHFNPWIFRIFTYRDSLFSFIWIVIKDSCLCAIWCHEVPWH